MTDYEGPGWGHPGEVFVDGDYKYQILVAPTLFPLWAATGSGVSGQIIGDLIFELGGRLVANIADPRWQLTIMRAPRSALARYKAVHLELFAELDDAEARRTEIAKKWVLGQYADSTALTIRNRRSMRRAGA